MKQISIKPFIFALPLFIATHSAYAYVYAADDEHLVAQQKTQVLEQASFVKVPVFEGGVTASIGALYLVPSADDQPFGGIIETDYEWGIDASLGYLFPDTANAIELFYREISTNSNNTDTLNFDEESPDDVEGSLTYDLNAFDLMLSQFIDVGDFMQMRFMGGASYLQVKQNTHLTTVNDTDNDLNNSDYRGWGLRVGIDSRYDFGQGFGIVAGGSTGYYLGKLDVETLSFEDNRDNHTVLNLRANIGVDYVFFYDYEDDHANVGIEIGYLFDYYNDAIGDIASTEFTSADTYAVSFNGPYVNLKGVF